MKHVVCLVGLSSSGKSLLASAAEELGMKLIKTREYVKNNNFDIKALIEGLKKLSIEKCEKPIENFIVIDSLKSVSQLDEVESVLGINIFVLGLHCDRCERELRYASKKKRVPTSETLGERDEREFDIGFSSIFAKANRILDSTGTTHSEFKGQVVSTLLDIVTSKINYKECRTRWEKRDRVLCYPKYP
jgi:ABC-type dipeptide/oligopeptide/nickel transport system ATPase component